MVLNNFRIGIRLKNDSYVMSEPKQNDNLKYHRHFGEYLQGVYNTIYEKAGKNLDAIKFVIPVIDENIDCYMEITGPKDIKTFIDYGNEFVRPCPSYLIPLFFSEQYVQTYNEVLESLNKKNMIDVINHTLLSKANKIGQHSELNIKGQPIVLEFSERQINRISTDITGDLKILYNKKWLPLNAKILRDIKLNNKQVAALLAFGVSMQYI